MRGSSRLLVSALLITVGAMLAGGCAAGLLGLAATQWTNWFKSDSTSDYRVYLNGYDTGISPNITGSLTLRGISERDYLVTVARPPQMRRGVHVLSQVQPGRAVQLNESNPYEGVAITGVVRRDTSGGPLMENVLVAAVFNGARRVADSGQPVRLPPRVADGLECMLAFTDSSGQFRLGPAKYGDWLVTAVLPGYVSDARHVRVTAGSDGNVPLVLTEDSGPAPGVVRGSVHSQAGQVIKKPLATGLLSAPFVPAINPAARSQVEGGAGVSMPAGNWFAWDALMSVGTDGGRYELNVPAGSLTVEAYHTDWRAESSAVSVGAGMLETANFLLARP